MPHPLCRLAVVLALFAPVLLAVPASASNVSELTAWATANGATESATLVKAAQQYATAVVTIESEGSGPTSPNGAVWAYQSSDDFTDAMAQMVMPATDLTNSNWYVGFATATLGGFTSVVVFWQPKWMTELRPRADGACHVRSLNAVATRLNDGKRVRTAGYVVLDPVTFFYAFPSRESLHQKLLAAWNYMRKSSPRNARLMPAKLPGAGWFYGFSGALHHAELAVTVLFARK